MFLKIFKVFLTCFCRFSKFFHPQALFGDFRTENVQSYAKSVSIKNI